MNESISLKKTESYRTQMEKRICLRSLPNKGGFIQENTHFRWMVLREPPYLRIKAHWEKTLVIRK